MTRRTKSALLPCSALNVALLFVALATYDDGPNRDVDVVLLVVMAALSFPSSVVVVAATGWILAGIYHLTGAYLKAGRGEIVLTWTLLFAIGIAQWFVLLPNIRKRLRRSAVRTE